MEGIYLRKSKMGRSRRRFDRNAARAYAAGGKERKIYSPRKVKEENFDYVKIRGTFSRGIYL